MLIRFFLTVCVLIGGVIAAQAERRVALVIGNGAYKAAPALPNPPKDAEAMASMLKLQGFEVVLGVDLDRDGMSATIAKFADTARGADVAMFFYAGHGIQIDGKNLLIPTDAVLKNEFDAKVRTVEIDTVLNHTMTDAKVKIVLLDACRENPFAKDIAAGAPKTRSVAVANGLAEMKPGEGTLIQFATAAGALAFDGTGENSPFTAALLKHLPAADIEIGLAMKHVRAQVAEDTRKQQQPWESTNMTGVFYMKKTAALTAPVAAAPVTTPGAMASLDPQVLELEFWNSIKGSTNSQDFKAYLDKYPNGTFASLARVRHDGLSRVASAPGSLSSNGSTANAPVSSDATAIRTAEASTATEDALGLKSESWQEAQRRLSALGFGTRGTDGRVGDGTRTGIRGWQAARGYPTTGYLNKLQHDALLAENVPAAVAKKPSRDDDDDDKPARKSANRGSGGSGGGSSGGGSSSGGSGGNSGSGAVGEFVGGVARGVIGKKWF